MEPGGAPLYKLDCFVPSQGVWVSSCCGLKMGVDFTNQV